MPILQDALGIPEQRAQAQNGRYHNDNSPYCITWRVGLSVGDLRPECRSHGFIDRLLSRWSIILCYLAIFAGLSVSSPKTIFCYGCYFVRREQVWSALSAHVSEVRHRHARRFSHQVIPSNVSRDYMFIFAA
jgi:hypothetical protein